RLSALQRCASPEVIPTRPGRKINTARGCSGARDGVDQKCWAEEELIGNVERVTVGGEVHHQRAHRCVPFRSHLPRKRVDVRQQAVAEFVIVPQDFLRTRTVRPQLICLARSVSAEDWAKRAVLKPAHENFLVRRIAGVSSLEAAYVGGPIGKAGHGVVQPSRDLAAQSGKVGSYVSRPCGGGVALLAQKRRPSEDDYTLFVGGGALSFIHGLRLHQRIHIDVARSNSEAGVCAFEHQSLFLAIEIERLRRIEPPGLDSPVKERGLYLLPESFASVGIEGVKEAAVGIVAGELRAST